MIKQLFIFCVGIGLFASCESPEATTANSSKETAISFQTQISRAVGNQWEVDDAIGIFQVPSEKDFSEAIAENVAYSTPNGDGAFTGKTPLYYPRGEESTMYDFIAYYPYKEGIKTNYAVNVSDQSQLNKLDLLYAKTPQQNSSNLSVHLNFRHQLSNLLVEVKAGKDIASLKNLSVILTNCPSQATFNLADGTLSDAQAVQDITLKTSVGKDELSARAQAIVIPSQLNGAQLIFKHPEYGDLTYTMKMEEFLKGKQYKLEATISKNGTIHGIELEDVNSSIEDWDTEGGDMGSIDENFNGNVSPPPVVPEVQDGNGTKDSPYSIAQILNYNTLKPGAGKYVKGYVLGVVNYKAVAQYPPITEEQISDLITSSNSKILSLLVSDTPTQEDVSKIIVLLAYGTIEDAVKNTIPLLNQCIKFRIMGFDGGFNEYPKYETVSSGTAVTPYKRPLQIE